MADHPGSITQNGVGMNIVLTEAAREYLAEASRQARHIVTHGERYTESQRRLAWRALAQQRRRAMDTAPVVRVGFEDGGAT